MKYLVSTFNQADPIDRTEGRLAYDRYRRMMEDLSDHYGWHDVNAVTAAFVALSPNSDYHGNLRSLVSCLTGLREGRAPAEITVSTYGHCRDRACAYLLGEEQFLDHAKGLKTRNFYRNICDPNDFEPVTIDGHIFAVWKNVANLPVKQARVSNAQYREIQSDIQELARAVGLIPNQLQATLWFTRKRVQRILYDPQFDLFPNSPEDAWRTTVDVREIRPYE